MCMDRGDNNDCPMSYDPMRMCQCTGDCEEYGNCCDDASSCHDSDDSEDDSEDGDELTTKKIAKPKALTHFPMVCVTGLLKKMLKPRACQLYVDVRLASTRSRSLTAMDASRNARASHKLAWPISFRQT